MTQAAKFKEVESLCGVARLAILEAMTHAADLQEGELRNDAIETIADTVNGFIEMFKGGSEGTWEVQTIVGDSWENLWNVDGKPTRFKSEAEAKQELDDFFAEQAEAVAKGHMDLLYDREDYQVVEVIHGQQS